VSTYNLTHILSKVNSLVYFKHSVLKKINHVVIFETKDYLDPDFSEMVQRMSRQKLIPFFFFFFFFFQFGLRWRV
jgi:hypothetical protein